MSGPEDQYASMTELLRNETEGEDYEFEIADEDRDDRVLIIAPHGGGIEPHTDELARKIAGEEFIFYAFRGIKPRHNYERLHVTSTNFDEPDAQRLANQAEVVLAVHGKSGDGEFAMVGGRHPELVGRVETLLDDLGIETQDPSADVAAQRMENICNRCRQGGVQLELSMALRKRLRRDAHLRDPFVQSVRPLLREAVSEPEEIR